MILKVIYSSRNITIIEANTGKIIEGDVLLCLIDDYLVVCICIGFIK